MDPGLRLAFSAALLLATLAPPADAPLVRVASEPDGAEVWIGARRVGVTTPAGLVISGLSPGRISLTLKKDGYVDAEKTIEIGQSSAPVALVVRLLRPGEREEQPARRVDDTVILASKKYRPGRAVGLLAAAMGAGTGAVLLAKTLAPDPATVDHDGDGYSAAQGDCNDLLAIVRPDGSVQASVGVLRVSHGESCSDGLDALGATVSNRSCQAIAIKRLSRSIRSLDGNCSWRGVVSFEEELPLAVTDLGPGELGVLVATVPERRSSMCCGAAGCCPRQTTCGFSEAYTLETSDGTFTSEFAYEVDFLPDRPCPPCTPSLPSPVCLP